MSTEHIAFVDGSLVERREAPTRKPERTEPPERLEKVARRCGVVTETGEPCSVWTLQPKCHKHRRQAAVGGQ